GLSRLHSDPAARLSGCVGNSGHIQPPPAPRQYFVRYRLRDGRSQDSFQMKQETLPPIEETIGAGAPGPPLSPRRSESIFRKRIRKFKTLKRGYYSFLLLIATYIVSFILPVLINNKALVVHYQGNFYFPILSYYPATQFGMDAIGEPNYRDLKRQLGEKN